MNTQTENQNQTTPEVPEGETININSIKFDVEMIAAINDLIKATIRFVQLLTRKA